MTRLPRIGRADRSSADRSDGTVLLGISCDFHDSAAAVVVNGEIVAAAEEERFSRVKHDASLPTGAVESCLRIAGLDAEDVDSVAFYEKPLTVVSRYLASRQRIGPPGLGSFVRDVPRLVRNNLMIGYRIDSMLRDLGRRRPTPVRYIEHHRSHAAAAYFPSPFDHAAVVTIDGIGEWATATVGRGSRHNLEILEEMRYPDSLGLVYSFVTSYCGFRPNEDESKIMGLAPYGTPRYLGQLSELAALAEDGSLGVHPAQMAWFLGSGDGRRSLRRMFDGPPRHFGGTLTQREADLAASVQALTENRSCGWFNMHAT